MLPEESYVKNYKEGLEYFKNKLFHLISILFIGFGYLLFFYGAYMFYIEGRTILAVIEVSLYFITIAIIIQKVISVRIRKLFFVLIMYILSLLILIYTGVMGAGMICITFILVFSGCILDKDQIIKFIIFDLIIFIALSIMLMYGNFDNTAIFEYKKIWLIVTMTTQFIGIGLITVMNIIYNKFEKQIQIINKSREQLKESESRLIVAQQIAHIGSWELDLDTNKIWASKESFNIYGIERISQYLTLNNVQENVFPDYRQLLNEKLNCLISKQGEYDVKFKVKKSEYQRRSIYSF